MKDRARLAVLIALAMLALAAAGWSQSTPSYRPPTSPSSSSTPSYRPPIKPSTSPSATPAPTPAPAAPSPAPTPVAPSPAPAPVATASAASSTVTVTPPGESVSILDSPAVPDLGGNCIICGLFRGDLTAVEPNLIICAREPNAQQDQACTEVCPRGHTCMNQRFLQAFPSGSSVRISVRNVDQKDQTGQPVTIAYGPVDVATCTVPNPCSLAANETVYGKDAAVKLALTPGCAPEAQSGTAQNQATSSSTPTTAGLASYYQETDKANKAGIDYTPSNTAKAYRSSLVDVQTGMTDGCDAQDPDLCNGITIHAKSSVPSARFVQFFYRQIFDQKGQPQVVPLRDTEGVCTPKGQSEVSPLVPGGHATIQQHPGSCMNTSDGQNLDWIPDDRANPNTQIADGSGTVTAVPKATPTYTQKVIDLSNYTSGKLVIDINTGNGAAYSSFNLFAGPTAPLTGGTPITQGQQNVKPESTAQLVYDFNFGANQSHQVILGAMGSAGSTSALTKSVTNTFTYTAKVDSGQLYSKNAYATALPFYETYITDTNGDGVTMYDSPSFQDEDRIGPEMGFNRSLFQGRTFVLSNDTVIACVDWTLQHGINLTAEPPVPIVKGIPPQPYEQNDYAGVYTNVNIVVFNPPLTQFPNSFLQVLDEYNIPNPIGLTLPSNGESVMPPAPVTAPASTPAPAKSTPSQPGGVPPNQTPPKGDFEPNPSINNIG